MNCHAGTFKTWMFLPDFVCAPAFLIKIISMTAFCLSVKTLLLRSSKLGNCETSERGPVNSTEFDLHCSCFYIATTSLQGQDERK